MRSIGDQTFYEILEVSAEATLQEIERAYRICRSTYEPNSLATYSVFSDDESAEILRRVDESYAVLSDARLRREYDARLRRESSGERVLPAREPPARPVLRPRPAPGEPGAGARESVDLELVHEPEDGIYDGTVLRRIRLSRGVELEEISSVTKINEMYLEYIEGNRYHELPAPVYVKGFLREYAKCLRLDPRRIADSYMQRYQGRAAKA